MPIINDANAWTDKLDAGREVIKESLTQVANDIGMALRDAGLHFPVFITVRDSGDSLATIATPVDPSDHDWQRASAIACEIIGKTIGHDGLRGRELTCAVANMQRISASDVTAG